MAAKIVNHIDRIKDTIKSGQDFVINGGAGSGKTYALIEAIKYVYEIEPKVNLACMTYTNIAVNEIKERAPFENLFVCTIHEFIWNLIKNYKSNLTESIVELVSAEKKEPGSGIRYNGEFEISIETYKPKEINYKEYRNIEDGIISHDEVLKLGLYMFQKYPILSRILADKYRYIFIDEYQDTSTLIIQLLLDVFRNNNKKSIIGLFGDPMQSIYNTGIGDVRSYIDDDKLKEITISGNRRCSTTVINVLNKVRTDISQVPENDNKQGSVTFLFSKNELDISEVKKHVAFTKWNFNNQKNTKELYLTHRLIARKQKFESLYNAYDEEYGNADKLLGDSPDKLAIHLLKMQEILFLYTSKKYNEFINRTDYKIDYHKDKVKLFNNIKRIIMKTNGTISEIVSLADKCSLCSIDDKLKEFFITKEDFFKKVMQLDYSELVNAFNYINKYSPYSTQHGIKGAEFDNVFVILDNGQWNNYNFEQLLGTVRNQKTYDRTHKLFYVCCSRAKINLVVYCPNFKQNMLPKTYEWFGKENVVELS